MRRSGFQILYEYLLRRTFVENQQKYVQRNDKTTVFKVLNLVNKSLCSYIKQKYN